MRRTILPLLIPTLGLALALPAAARPLTPAQEAKIQSAGKPVDCVEINRIRETRVRDDRTIDFYMDGGRVYRNRLPNSCSELGFEERFGYATTTGELCNVDIIHVLHSGAPFRGPACGLGEFQPITGAPR